MKWDISVQLPYCCTQCHRLWLLSMLLRGGERSCRARSAQAQRHPLPFFHSKAAGPSDIGFPFWAGPASTFPVGKLSASFRQARRYPCRERDFTARPHILLDLVERILLRMRTHRPLRARPPMLVHDAVYRHHVSNCVLATDGDPTAS